MGSSSLLEDTPLLDQQPVMPLITQSVAAQTAHSHTDVNSVVPTTALSTAPTEAVLVNKPKPLTPLRLFILKHELSDYPDKAFVEQLIHDLCHSCAIGYNGPLFSYLAKNLLSAFQQLKVINTTLAREYKLERILEPFQTPPLPNFSTSGLGLVPKHNGGWQIIYHLSAPLIVL